MLIHPLPPTWWVMVLIVKVFFIVCFQYGNEDFLSELIAQACGKSAILIIIQLLLITLFTHEKLWEWHVHMSTYHSSVARPLVGLSVTKPAPPTNLKLYFIFSFVLENLISVVLFSVSILPEKSHFNVDNVRVIKILVSILSNVVCKNRPGCNLINLLILLTVIHQCGCKLSRAQQQQQQQKTLLHNCEWTYC